MHAQRFFIRPLAAAALVCAAVAANAAITVSTSQSGFLAATGGSIDSFSDLTINTDLGVNTLARSAGSLGYTVSTATDFFVVPVASAIALSTGFYSDSITFNGFVTPVRSLGANFYGTNILGEVASGALTVVATDTNGLVSTQSVAGGSATGFLGFISDAPLASVVVRMTTANTDRWATVDNVVLSAVPEASTWLMMLLGGVAVLRAGARRRG